MSIKHATASVFLFASSGAGWRLGLIEHPRLGRLMIPGGHVEADESQAEAAVREVVEETGLEGIRLLEAPAPALPAGFPHERVASPWWITKQPVPLAAAQEYIPCGCVGEGAEQFVRRRARGSPRAAGWSGRFSQCR
jgi:8-oxo-dGTP pyrophosphatase MutT (NUDIX family)